MFMMNLGNPAGIFSQKAQSRVLMSIFEQMCPLKVEYEGKDVTFLFNYTNVLKAELLSSQITS